MIESYQISVGAFRWLRTKAEREQKASHREVCGLLVTEDGFRIRLLYLTNEAAHPGTFLIGQKSYESAEYRARARGMKVIGTFHSHPISEAIPGSRDIATAKTGSLMLIYDVCGRQARLWTIRGSKGHREARELVLDFTANRQDIRTAMLAPQREPV